MRPIRSVLLAEEHPWPPRGGIALRNAANAAALARLGPLAIVGVGDPAGRHPPSRLGEHISVGLGHPPRPDPHDDWARRPNGHPSDGRWDEHVTRAWQALLGWFRPDVVVVEQLWLHHAVADAHALGVSVVLDAHNVEAAVYRDIADDADDGGRALSGAMAARTAALEAQTVTAVDQVWCCSRRDAVTIGAAGRARVVVNAVDTDALRLRAVRRRAPNLVFTASFAYPPNVRAARSLVEDVLPAFQRGAPGATLSLVGRDPPRWLRRMACGREDVEVTGAVPSTRPWLERASVTVIPLAAGSGTRFKVLEALALGLPVVSSPKGVEGLDVVPGEHVLVATDPDDLARLALHAHRTGGGELVAAGRCFVTERYSWQVVAGAVRRHLAELVGE